MYHFDREFHLSEEIEMSRSVTPFIVFGTMYIKSGEYKNIAGMSDLIRSLNCLYCLSRSPSSLVLRMSSSSLSTLLFT